MIYELKIKNYSSCVTILGVDPGTDRAGYGILKKDGQALALIDAGILKVGKLRGPDALLAIHIHLGTLIREHKPDLFATEKLFFAQNRSTGMTTAEARGVILLAAREHNIPIREFAPTEVKMAVAGYGQADKAAVLKMVRLILKAPQLDVIDDASDALAIAITAANADRGRL